MATEEKKIIYSYRASVPPASANGKPEVTEEKGVWPSCLPKEWKTGNAFPEKSTIGPGGWDLDEIKCECGRHLLRSRKTYTTHPYEGPVWGEYVPDIHVEVLEI